MTGAGAAGHSAGVLVGARVRWTGRADGDLRPHAPGGAARLEQAAARPVAWLRQVHGDRVVVVDDVRAATGEQGDALVTTAPHLALAVLTADCAPVALASPEGVVGAVHAGWAGLLAGVVNRAVAIMRELGATSVTAALGPCIHSECYEFGGPHLERVARVLGPSVRAVTPSGSPALDLPAAVSAALTGAGAALVSDEDVCTACAADRYFSHRARAEVHRQAMLVWRAP